MNNIKIAFVSSEVYPFAKTGGLADVAGTLPIELFNLGVEVKIFMPKYSTIDEDSYHIEYLDSIGSIKVRVGGVAQDVKIYKSYLPDSKVEVYFIDAPQYFHRGHIYTNDWDEDSRFILFQKSVIETLQRLQWAPDVIHCNDWQTALIPLYIKDNYSWDKLFSKTAVILTIHNIGYQGRFPKETAKRAEIRDELFYPGGPIELNGKTNFLKAGIFYADIINTVSETYANELLTKKYGAELDTVLLNRSNDFYGILNGIDCRTWCPEHDTLIPFQYSKRNITVKIKNKEFLCEKMDLPFNKNIPLIGIISRLVTQKGFDIITDTLPHLMNLNVQWVILGSGEGEYEFFFESLAQTHPEKVAAYIGFNNKLSHLIEAGADIFLMPSQYEPCGLNQLYSLKYGTVPIVRKTGGLADTIFDWDEMLSFGLSTGNGFSFYDYNGYSLSDAIHRAIKYFHNKKIWRKIQLNGMKTNHSWKTSAKKYLELYRKAINKRNPI